MESYQLCVPMILAANLICLQFGIPRWLPSAVIKNSTKHENDYILVTAEWILMKFVSKCFSHLVVFKFNKKDQPRWLLHLKVAKFKYRENLIGSVSTFSECFYAILAFQDCSHLPLLKVA